ncbi:MAG TPA: hypothetical protein VIV60_22520, partial [Polyangiaceae bacterium]
MVTVSRLTILLSVLVCGGAVKAQPATGSATASAQAAPATVAPARQDPDVAATVNAAAAAHELVIDRLTAIRLAELHAPELLEPE